MATFSYPGSREFSHKFEAFAGLLSRNGAYNSKSSDKPSDGTVLAYFMDEDDETPPSAEQLAAIQHLLDHPVAVREALLLAISQEYASLKEQFVFDPSSPEELMYFPQMKTTEDYSQVFGVGNLFIFKEQLDGFAYVGLECGCTWDDEHGMGIVMHRDRVIAFGQADTAFSSWEARNDIARQSGDIPVGDPIEELTEDMEELKSFLKESSALQTKAREKLEEVKRGKRWWEFWK